MWRWRCRRRGVGRPFKEYNLYFIPNVKKIVPHPVLNEEPIEMSYLEFEAFRLSALEKLEQEEIAKRMNTSRATVWRLLESSSEKIARAIVESRPLLILPKGEIESVEGAKDSKNSGKRPGK